VEQSAIQARRSHPSRGFKHRRYALRLPDSIRGLDRFGQTAYYRVA
jgi:hypothetical protein